MAWVELQRKDEVSWISASRLKIEKVVGGGGTRRGRGKGERDELGVRRVDGERTDSHREIGLNGWSVDESDRVDSKD